MKALTVKQPFASLICAGLKDVENRSWPTDYRGRILIHSSKTPAPVDVYTGGLPLPVHRIYRDMIRSDYTVDGAQGAGVLEYHQEDDQIRLTPEAAADPRLSREFHLLLTDAVLAEEMRDTAYPGASIVGAVTIADCIQNSPSAWSDAGAYHWILTDPVLFMEPTRDIRGRLKLWNFSGILISEQEITYVTEE